MPIIIFMYGCLEVRDVSENVLETKIAQRYFTEIHAANTSKQYKTLKIYKIMDRIVNSLIIIKTFPIQQAGRCNGGSETGQNRRQ